jgi:hypothetical protein
MHSAATHKVAAPVSATTVIARMTVSTALHVDLTEIPRSD